MKLAIVLDDGEVQDVLDGIEEYDLTKHMACSHVANQIGQVVEMYREQEAAMVIVKERHCEECGTSRGNVTLQQHKKVDKLCKKCRDESGRHEHNPQDLG